MKLEVYSYRDKNLGFGAPVVHNNEPMAIRNFTFDVVNSVPLMKTFPQDFDLYRIGYYDTEDGKIEPVFPPKFITNAAAVRRQYNDETTE